MVQDVKVYYGAMHADAVVEIWSIVLFKLMISFELDGRSLQGGGHYNNYTISCRFHFNVTELLIL